MRKIEHVANVAVASVVVGAALGGAWLLTDSPDTFSAAESDCKGAAVQVALTLEQSPDSIAEWLSDTLGACESDPLSVEALWLVDTASDGPDGYLEPCAEDQVHTFDRVCVTPGDPYVKYIPTVGWMID